MYPILIKQSEVTAARRRVPIWLVDATDGITAEMGVTGTPRISKNGGASAAAAGTITEVDATNMPGLYYLEFTAAEVDTLGTVLVSFKTAATAQWHGIVHVVAFDPYSAADLGLTNLDAAVSSRAVAGDAMSLTAGAVDSVWDEAQSGHVTAGTFGKRLDADVSTRSSHNAAGVWGEASRTITGGTIDTNNDKLGYGLAADAVNAAAIAVDGAQEIADELLKRDLGAVTGEASRSALNALRFIRNRFRIQGTTLTVFKEDDTTTAWTATITATAGADPITESDPA